METEAPGYTWRRTSGAAPDAVKVARPVLNGGDEETGLCRPRLVATQLECGRCHSARTIPQSSSLWDTKWAAGAPSQVGWVLRTACTGASACGPSKNLTQILHKSSLSYDFSPPACHTPTVRTIGHVPRGRAHMRRTSGPPSSLSPHRALR